MEKDNTRNEIGIQTGVSVVVLHFYDFSCYTIISVFGRILTLSVMSWEGIPLILRFSD